MYNKFIKLKILIVIVLLTMLAAGGLVNAAGLIKPDVKENINKNTQNIGGAAGYEDVGDDSALILAQTVISVFLSIIGILLLVYILYAGYNWLTAQGEEEKVTKAKDTIKRAIIGVIIIIAAYAISTFVISRLERGTLKGASAGQTIAFITVIPA